MGPSRNRIQVLIMILVAILFIIPGCASRRNAASLLTNCPKFSITASQLIFSTAFDIRYRLEGPTKRICGAYPSGGNMSIVELVPAETMESVIQKLADPLLVQSSTIRDSEEYWPVGFTWFEEEHSGPYVIPSGTYVLLFRALPGRCMRMFEPSVCATVSNEFRIMEPTSYMIESSPLAQEDQ